MKMSFHIRSARWDVVLIAIAELLIFGIQANAQGPRIRLAVIGLDNPATLSKSNIGNSLVDILDSDISAAGKYTLLERAELEQLKQELNLGESGLANAKSFAPKGGIVGADFLLLGKVSHYTYRENRFATTQYVPGAGVQQIFAYNHVAEVRVDIRLVDVKTGEDARSVSGHGTAHNAGSASYQVEWGYYVASQGQGSLSNLGTLLTEASNQAIQQAVGELNDMYDDLAGLRANSNVSSEVSSIGGGKVLADIGNGVFVIGVPSTANLKVGDRFDVIAEVPIKNTQGVVVYQEKRTIGAVQITNISESTKALAQLVQTSASGASAQSIEGDTLVFDENYGKSLRGLVPAGTGAASSGASAASVGPYIERGNRFMNNQEYSEALNQYRDGLAVDPKNGTLLAGKAEAELGIDDWMDAEDDAEKAVAAGGSVHFPAYHIHAFGHCEGMLVIQSGKVSYQPTTGNDSFTATSKNQISISQKDFPAQGSRVPDLWIQATDQGGKERKYEMIFPVFLPRPSPNMAINFQVTTDAASKTKRLDGMIVRLVSTSLQ
jgi:curli biogenesis system outer membrane secretion channel CsgG